MDVEAHRMGGRQLRREGFPEIEIAGRRIGREFKPFVIAEIGINHEGSFKKAARMIDDAALAGCECVKFQCHIVEDEMSEEARGVIPGNADESIWNIMERCSLSFDDEKKLKSYTESKGMIYLSTPFSRLAAERLESMNVPAYKIGSGECNNYPLVEHIATYGKPVIMSTGMNNLDSVGRSVDILRKHGVPFALMHCTSIYPTPYGKARLGALRELSRAFPDAPVGLSDHSIGNYTSFAAVALGACILEKHFTSDPAWPGPDVPISIDPAGLRDLITGTNAVYEASGGEKNVLPEEKPTIDFAYASVVAYTDIRKGDKFTRSNLWVRRPGNGDFGAGDYNSLIGLEAAENIPAGRRLCRKDVIFP